MMAGRTMNGKLFRPVIQHEPPNDQGTVLGFCRDKGVLGEQNLFGNQAHA